MANHDLTLGDCRHAACACALLIATAAHVLAESSAPVADATENLDRLSLHALLKQGEAVNAAQIDGMTALHWAAYHDEFESATLLINSGADVRAKNRYGVTPLALACTNGHAELVELLLASGADPNATLRGGETALMTAARTGRLRPVKALIAHGADVHAVERSGQSALMWAAADGHAEVVDALIAAGADFSTPLESGFTPFFFAIREGHANVVNVLMAAGAHVNEAMRPEEHRAERKPERGTSPLMLAIENGHFQLAAKLLETGADPNDERSGFTPLHAMTWVRKPNRGDGSDGDPPPRGSGDVGSLQFVRILVSHGADVNTQLKKGRSGRGRLNLTGATPLLMAAKNADVPLLQLLVELGANPRLPNVDRATPLMAAAGLGTLAPGEEAGTEPEALAAVKFLLERGGDVNGIDDNGETAMHGAAYKSLPQVVELLSENGASIDVWNRANKYGWTPLMIAEGHRPGNFKPSVETIAALHHVMRAAGVEPPAPTPRKQRRGYDDR